MKLFLLVWMSFENVRRALAFHRFEQFCKLRFLPPVSESLFFRRFLSVYHVGCSEEMAQCALTFMDMLTHIFCNVSIFERETPETPDFNACAGEVICF